MSAFKQLMEEWKSIAPWIRIRFEWDPVPADEYREWYARLPGGVRYGFGRSGEEALRMLVESVVTRPLSSSEIECAAKAFQVSELIKDLSRLNVRSL